MGLLVYVYRKPLGDCTLDVISSRYTRLCVSNIEGSFVPSSDYPEVILHSHVRGCLRLVPPDYKTRWYTTGGNYGATSDSRFSEACEKLLGHEFYGAVAIHDRYEPMF